MSLKRLATPLPIMALGLLLFGLIVWGTPLWTFLVDSFQQAVIRVFTYQRTFHRELVTLLQRLSGGAAVDAGLWLVLIAFTYGIFHAAGPGHGKAVISTFLLTNRVRLRRGLLIAVGGALCQGVTAVVLVYGLVWLFGWRPTDTMSVISWSERMSFVVLMLMGLYLLWRAGRDLLSRVGSKAQDDAPDDDLIPDASEINRADNLYTIVGLMLAIGIRPCSGAVLVLVFAYTLQIAWAGVAAAMAMAVGTAITVSVLALITVKASALARVWSTTPGPWAVGLRKVGGMLAVLCGVFLAFLGGSMLFHSFAPRLSSGIM